MTWRIVTPEWPPHAGGVATWAWECAHALHEAGEDVVVHARCRAPSSPTPFRVRAMWGRSWAAWGAVWAALDLRASLRAGDVLVFANWELARHAIGRARRLGVPVGVTWHGSDLTRPSRFPDSMARRWFGVLGRDAVARACVNLPVSRFLASLLPVPAAAVLPAPVDPGPIARPGERLLVVARLVKSKGVDDALRLAARLARPITVVGDGPERAALERLAGELGVEARFTGALPRADVPWDGTWALVLLSRPDPPEGLGLVLLEAAARGVPSIGTRVGGIPEAADVVLDDPRDAVPETLPRGEVVRRRVEVAHGRAALVAELRATLRESGY